MEICYWGYTLQNQSLCIAINSNGYKTTTNVHSSITIVSDG